MTSTTTARAPRAVDAAEIRTALRDLVNYAHPDEVHNITAVAGQVYAYLDGEAARLPARVGSPAMRVVAAIPIGTEGREVIAVVEQSGWPAGSMRYGTIHGYRNDLEDGTVRWSAEAGHYDYTDLTKAIRGMCSRAGIKVVWPDPPELTENMVLAQRMAEQMWAVATCNDHAMAWFRSPVYRHMDLAFRAAVKVAYGVSDLIADRVRALLSEYGPDDSLSATTGRRSGSPDIAGRGIYNYVRFAQTHSRRDYHY